MERGPIHRALKLVGGGEVVAGDHIHIQSLEHASGVGVLGEHALPMEDVLPGLQSDPLQVLLGNRFGEHQEQVQVGVRQEGPL